jgi:hypothetical protein
VSNVCEKLPLRKGGYRVLLLAVFLRMQDLYA